MAPPYRVLIKGETAICTEYECGRTIRVMVWDRGADHLCVNCIERYDARVAYRECNGNKDAEVERRHAGALRAHDAAKRLTLPIAASQYEQMAFGEAVMP